MDGGSPSQARDCPSTTELSAGNAAFMVIAILLGLLAQPEGSLSLTAFHSKLSTWNMLPSASVFESSIIIIYLFRALYRRQSHITAAIALMLERTPFEEDDHRAAREIIGRPKLELTLPITLQIIKVMFIRGSVVTQVLCAISWTHWALVQYIHYIAYHHLSHTARADNAAASIPHGEMVEIPDWLFRLGYCSTVAAAGVAYLGCYLFTIITAPQKPQLLIWIVIPMLGGIILLLPTVYGLCHVASIIRGDTRLPTPGPTSEEVFASHVVRFITLGLLVLYYILYYDSTDTYRPAWLDWLG